MVSKSSKCWDSHTHTVSYSRRLVSGLATSADIALHLCKYLARPSHFRNFFRHLDSANLFCFLLLAISLYAILSDKLCKRGFFSAPEMRIFVSVWGFFCAHAIMHRSTKDYVVPTFDLPCSARLWINFVIKHVGSYASWAFKVGWPNG